VIGVISWLNLLSGPGMMAVGAGAMAYWYYKKRINPVYFLFGAVLWAAAIAIKVAMDLTISAPFTSQLAIVFTPLATVAILGLYYGLRTGLFESGISWLAVRYTRLSRSGFDEAVALGVGFGGSEAILLGAASFLNVAALLLMPELAATLPASVQEQFSLLMVPVPAIERLFTLFCHVFATVLVVYAVRVKEVKWLALSVMYKTLLDGLLLPFNFFLKGAGTLSIILALEAFVIVLGIAGLAGVMWIRNKFLAIPGDSGPGKS
jgi:uncharacterized membrane protein YhfC